MTTIDTRFAGGSTTVASTARESLSRGALVTLDFPGHSVSLFAHEARNLANALIEHARIAESFERESRPVSELEAQHEGEGIPHPVSGDDLARLRLTMDDRRIILAERATASAPGVFGVEERDVRIARRLADGAEAFVTVASPMEGEGFIAWVLGNYSLHYVHVDPIEAARAVIDNIYGAIR